MELLLHSAGNEIPSSHYDFDIGLVLTEFTSTLQIRSAIHRGHYKYLQSFPEDDTSDLVVSLSSLFRYKRDK